MVHDRSDPIDYAVESHSNRRLHLHHCHPHKHRPCLHVARVDENDNTDHLPHGRSSEEDREVVPRLDTEEEAKDHHDDHHHCDDDDDGGDDHRDGDDVGGHRRNFGGDRSDRIHRTVAQAVDGRQNWNEEAD